MQQPIESSYAAAGQTEAGPRPHNVPVANVWSAGGADYDEVSRGILDAIEHCVNRLRPRPDERILDVATGTGWTARRVAERGAAVTAVDIASGELEAARRISTRMGLNTDFRLGDAEALPFQDATFDGVISTFGVMFASRPADAAAELARVCRHGGRIALATWAPDGGVFGMFRVIKAYMPAPAVQPPPSPFEWGHRERVTELLGRDFDLTFEAGTSYYREPDGEAAWQTFSTGYGPVKVLAQKLDPEAREAFRRDFVAFHETYREPLGICVPREYLIVHGVRR